MTRRVVARILTRLLGGAVTYVTAAVIFNDQRMALFAAAAYVLTNWFNATVGTAVVAIVFIASHNLVYAIAAGAIFVAGAILYSTVERLDRV